jgi:hypothetical protein
MSLSRAVSAVVSRRALAIWLLAGCALLAIGPWLRPPITRDLRGPHIPWGEMAAPTFFPEVVSQTPRPWRWNSIATPLLAVIAVGVVVILARPKWTSRAFGVLLAVSLPAAAVALWNYPTLVESFDSEMRDRTLLRAVFRQHSEHMLSAGTSDRLAVLSDKTSRKEDLLLQPPPVLAPMRYSTYGLWLVGVALLGVVVWQRGTWVRRIGYAGAWAGVGVALAFAATWPRWLAEYRWARAAALENGHDFTAANQLLESAKVAMPAMGNTWRYWLAKGRISFRQREAENRYQAFFLAHQAVLNDELDRARALMEPHVGPSEGTTTQRDLLASVIARRAADYASDGKYSGAELSWGEAAATAPWKAAYRIAHQAAQLAVAPHRAAEVQQQALADLEALGDRMVSSDFHSLVGDAYFVAGDFERARAMYDRALALFHLPKYTNIPAQEGRLGM